MKKLPLERRLEYWKYENAVISFRNAGEVAAFLMNHQNPPLKYPLLTSLYVLYGRPFKQGKRLRISQELVPDGYRDIHNYLITLRDKLFAHVDAVGPKEWNRKHLSKIILGWRDGGFRTGMQQEFTQGFQFDKVKNLCDHLRDVCNSESEAILVDAVDDTKLHKNLTFEVDLSEEDTYLLEVREM